MKHRVKTNSQMLDTCSDRRWRDRALKNWEHENAELAASFREKLREVASTGATLDDATIRETFVRALNGAYRTATLTEGNRDGRALAWARREGLRIQTAVKLGMLGRTND